jgi:hypothetical protein
MFGLSNFVQPIGIVTIPSYSVKNGFIWVSELWGRKNGGGCGKDAGGEYGKHRRRIWKKRLF